MSKPSAPEPTDPHETSSAATGTNVSTAIANNIMGNVNQVGPDGTTMFNQSGDYKWTDPYTGETYTVPKFTQTTTLSPEQLAIKEQTDATKLNLGTLANSQSSFLNDYMAKPFSYDTNDHEKWALSLYDKLNSGKEAQQQQGLESQLANSGIKLGSDAYDRAMRNNETSTMDSRNRFLLDSLGQGFGMAQATRNQPINEITSLMSGSQVSQPQAYGPNMTRIPTTDNAGIISNYDNQRMQQWQAEMAQRNAMMGGLFSLGSSFIGMSDRRAKKNIKKIGSIPITRDDGREARTGLYAWNYKGEKGGKPRHQGVMAQNIAKAKPSAVVETPSGLLAVDYGAL